MNPRRGVSSGIGPAIAGRAEQARPGDVITFGDHTGLYRVRRVSWQGARLVVRAWWRRRRIVSPDAPVWWWQS